MTPTHLRRFAVEPAFVLLPVEMTSPEASALIVAIAWQESRISHRRQIKGPARGYVQFERGGIAGVLTHPSSQAHARDVLEALDYQRNAVAATCLTAVEHNDVLCAAFARLLLWTDPAPLPGQDDEAGAWDLYLRCWRPGKPHPETWAEAFRIGWAA